MWTFIEFHVPKNFILIWTLSFSRFKDFPVNWTGNNLAIWGWKIRKLFYLTKLAAHIINIWSVNQLTVKLVWNLIQRAKEFFNLFCVFRAFSKACKKSINFIRTDGAVGSESKCLYLIKMNFYFFKWISGFSFPNVWIF